MDKSELRKRMKQLRKDMFSEERAIRNKKAYENFIQVINTVDTEWIYPFVSYGTEIDTIEIIKYCLGYDNGRKQRYNVAVPRVNGDRMDFYKISDMDELKPGFFGIPEPVGDNPIEICDGIVIMPGLAFDSDFGRIGYGGGYYDRFLSENQNVNLKKIALAYEFQMCTPGEIEMEEHDCRPDIIVTDSRIYT